MEYRCIAPFHYNELEVDLAKVGACEVAACFRGCELERIERRELSRPPHGYDLGSDDIALQENVNRDAGRGIANQGKAIGCDHDEGKPLWAVPGDSNARRRESIGEPGSKPNWLQSSTKPTTCCETRRRSSGKEHGSA